ncbi:hypothetical protein V8C35DRAFT_312506 [Trichoderma chlorosporum]
MGFILTWPLFMSRRRGLLLCRIAFSAFFSLVYFLSVYLSRPPPLFFFILIKDAYSPPGACIDLDVSESHVGSHTPPMSRAVSSGLAVLGGNWHREQLFRGWGDCRAILEPQAYLPLTLHYLCYFFVQLCLAGPLPMGYCIFPCARLTRRVPNYDPLVGYGYIRRAGWLRFCVSCSLLANRLDHPLREAKR